MSNPIPPGEMTPSGRRVVHVGHAERGTVDAGQRRHVHQLLQAAIAPNLCEQRGVGEHTRGDRRQAHDLVQERTNLTQLELDHDRLTRRR
jgi:hypothetical protein